MEIRFENCAKERNSLSYMYRVCVHSASLHCPAKHRKRSNRIVFIVDWLLSASPRSFHLPSRRWSHKLGKAPCRLRDRPRGNRTISNARRGGGVTLSRVAVEGFAGSMGPGPRRRDAAINQTGRVTHASSNAFLLYVQVKPGPATVLLSAVVRRRSYADPRATLNPLGEKRRDLFFFYFPWDLVKFLIFWERKRERWTSD